MGVAACLLARGQYLCCRMNVGHQKSVTRGQWLCGWIDVRHQESFSPPAQLLFFFFPTLVSPASRPANHILLVIIFFFCFCAFLLLHPGLIFTWWGCYSLHCSINQLSMHNLFSSVLFVYSSSLWPLSVVFFFPPCSSPKSTQLSSPASRVSGYCVCRN